MRISSLLFALLAGGSLLLADQPTPQNPPDLKMLSLEQLSQIEITSVSKQAEPAFQTPAAIFVITGEDIRRSGATSIPDALRLAPGVEVAQIDANKWSIGIRGFGTRLTRSVLVLIDGRTVFTPLFDGTYWEVQDTLLEDVDRIEIIRGPGGTIWGPNAVNGVINIITKNAAETKGALVSAGGGNQQQGFLNMRFGGGDSKGFSYRVYAKGFTNGPELHSDHANFDDWRSAQGGFRMDWDRGTGSVFNLQGDMYSQVAGESVSASSYTPPYSQIINANAYLSGGNLMGSWKKDLGNGDDVRIQAYFDRTSRSEPNIIDFRDTYDIDFVQHMHFGEWNQFTWGLGARIDPIRNVAAVSGLTFVPAKRNDYLITGFLQDEITLVRDKLSLTLGSKLLKTNFTHGPSPEPSVQLAWTPDDRHTIWASFTHSLRTPSDVEENFFLSGYVGALPDGTPYLARFNANQNFAPEQLNGFDLGYRERVGEKVIFSVTGFYNHYHDLLSEDITGSPFFESTPGTPHELLPAQFRNGLLAYTKGFELTPVWTPLPFWRLRGSYSYLHMNVYRSPNSGDIGTASGIIGASPQHQGIIISSFDLPGGLQLDLDVRGVSALPGQNVPAYWSANARFGWKITPHVDVSLNGQNLFQPSHYEDGGDPTGLVAIRRGGFLRVTWTR